MVGAGPQFQSMPMSLRRTICAVEIDDSLTVAYEVLANGFQEYCDRWDLTPYLFFANGSPSRIGPVQRHLLKGTGLAKSIIGIENTSNVVVELGRRIEPTSEQGGESMLSAMFRVLRPVHPQTVGTQVDQPYIYFLVAENEAPDAAAAAILEEIASIVPSDQGPRVEDPATSGKFRELGLRPVHVEFNERTDTLDLVEFSANSSGILH